MQARPPLPALTGLRFIAALQVMLYHLFPRQLAPEWLRPVLASGYVGVSLFFVLSGFILAYNYAEGFEAGGVSRGEFWKARFARVYPVYLLGLLIAIPPFLLGGRPLDQVAARVAPSVVAGIPALQAWLPRASCVVNCPGWSISAEAFFYFLFPFVVVVLVRLRGRALLAAGAAAWAAALAMPVLYLALMPDGPRPVTSDSTGYWLVMLKYNPLARSGEFVMGICAALVFLRRAPATGLAWLEPAALATLGAALWLGPALPYPVLHNGLLAPLFVMLIYRLGRGDGAAAPLLGRPLLATLGGASYALYILHVPVGSWTGVLLRRSGVEWGPLTRFAVVATVTLAASLAVYRYFEDPARRWVRNVTVRWPRTPRLAPEASTGD